MPRSPKLDDDDLLDRATQAVWRSGWSQTSIRDLERVLDMKAPSIYRRFGTKDGLGVAVVDHYVDRVVHHRIDRYLPGTGEPIENIVGFLESAVTESDDGVGLWGCLLTTMSAESDGIGWDVRDAVARGLSVIEDALGREVRRADELGSLRPGVRPEAAASVLVLAMQGLMSLARAGASPEQLRRHARRAVSTIAPDAPSA